MEPVLRAGHADPPDDLREALRRLTAARESLALEALDIGQFCAQATAEGQDPIAFLRRLVAAT